MSSNKFWGNLQTYQGGNPPPSTTATSSVTPATTTSSSTPSSTSPSDSLHDLHDPSSHLNAHHANAWRSHRVEVLKKQHVPSLPPSSFGPSESKDINWYYKDPQGSIQGPFQSAEMKRWYHAHFFDLEVRKDTDTHTHTHTHIYISLRPLAAHSIYTNQSICISRAQSVCFLYLQLFHLCLALLVCCFTCLFVCFFPCLFSVLLTVIVTNSMFSSISWCPSHYFLYPLRPMVSKQKQSLFR